MNVSSPFSYFSPAFANLVWRNEKEFSHKSRSRSRLKIITRLAGNNHFSSTASIRLVKRFILELYRGENSEEVAERSNKGLGNFDRRHRSLLGRRGVLQALSTFSNLSLSFSFFFFFFLIHLVPNSLPRFAATRSRTAGRKSVGWILNVLMDRTRCE